MLEETIIIKNIPYSIRENFAVWILFEDITGKLISDQRKVIDNLKLIYCYLFVNNEDMFKFSFEDFYKMIENDTHFYSEFFIKLANINKVEQKKN
jgi:hypothetical protein